MLRSETDAHIALIDRHGKPAGHCNDAYPPVAPHQPSAFYSIDSVALGTHCKDIFSPNEGDYGWASGAEVSSYFDRVKHLPLLARAVIYGR